jgi:methionyl-tRNA formyltransferase
MGTPEFGVKSLEVLAQSKHKIAGVLTNPDRPSGRGNKVIFSPIKQKAIELNIPVFQPEKINTPEFKEILDRLKPDLLITVCCSHYITKWIREYPHFGSINLHPSLLPLYRGTSPIIEPIIRGDKKSGITTFYLDKGWDTGDMIIQSEIPIDEKETGGSLHDKLSLLGSEILLKTVNLIEEGKVIITVQNHELACYTDKIFPGHGEIVWSCPSIEIERKIRAFNPFPGTYTCYKGEKVKIWEANTCGEYEGKPGIIVHASEKEGLVIGTGQGLLEIITLQMPSRKKTGAREFLRGYKMNVGETLGEKTDEKSAD